MNPARPDSSPTSPCFLGFFPQAPTPRRAVRKQCCMQSEDPPVKHSRRGILRAIAGAAALRLYGVLEESPAHAEDPVCRNCSGGGKSVRVLVHSPALSVWEPAKAMYAACSAVASSRQGLAASYSPDSALPRRRAFALVGPNSDSEILPTCHSEVKYGVVTGIHRRRTRALEAFAISH
eukprot:IDg9729t1